MDQKNKKRKDKVMKKYQGTPVLRTPLIVNGYNKKYIQKAFRSKCDSIVLDLEDGVPINLKDDARRQISATLNSDVIDGRPVFVRVNSLETGLTEQDIQVVACANLDGFLYTKPYSAGDLIVFDNIITEKEKDLGLPIGHFKIIVVMETPASIINSEEIALSSKRIIGMLFGAEDLLGDTKGSHSEDGRSLLFARSKVLLTCRAHNLIPIDTPYIDVHNIEGLKKFIDPAKELGYEGMLLVSPSQADIVREYYTPDEEQIKHAYEVLEIAENNRVAGTGASLTGSVFVAPPTLKQAKKLIERYKAIRDFEKYMEEILNA